MAFLDFLSGAGEIGDAQGFNVNKSDFEIKDADKLFGQTQEQFQGAKARGAALEPKRTGLMNALEQRSMGQGPSLAAEQLKQAQDRSLAQQLAAASASRASNPAAMQRELLRAKSAQNADLGQAAAQARIQEQTAATAQYQQMLGQEQQSVDQLTQQYLGMGFNIRQAQEQALADYNRLQVQQATSMADINAQNQRARGQMTGQLVGGLISGGAALASAGMMSKAAPAAGAAAPGMTAGGAFPVAQRLPASYGDFGQLTYGNYAQPAQPTPPFLNRPSAKPYSGY